MEAVMLSIIDPFNRVELLRKSTVGIVLGHMRDHVGFSVAFMSQLQLWHLNWLLAVHFVRDQHSQVP
jgi:hypothetical protein